jgi:hypothetical protein
MYLLFPVSDPSSNRTGKGLRARPWAPLNDKLRNRSGATFFAILVDHIGELALGECVDQVFRAHRRVGIHAHVYGAFKAKREAALGGIDLMATHAQVGKDSVDGVQTCLLEMLF